LYFYDNMYSPQFGPYFYDLKELLPKEHINMYESELIKQSCYYENKLVGLVIKYFFIIHKYIFIENVQYMRLLN